MLLSAFLAAGTHTSEARQPFSDTLLSDSGRIRTLLGYLVLQERVPRPHVHAFTSCRQLADDLLQHTQVVLYVLVGGGHRDGGPRPNVRLPYAPVGEVHALEEGQDLRWRARSTRPRCAAADPHRCSRSGQIDGARSNRTPLPPRCVRCRLPAVSPIAPH